MAEFFRHSRVWVLDFQYDGHPRRWLRALPEGCDAAAHWAAELQALYGGRARLLQVRPASDDEDRQYGRGEGARLAACPTAAGTPLQPLPSRPLPPAAPHLSDPADPVEAPAARGRAPGG